MFLCCLFFFLIELKQLQKICGIWRGHNTKMPGLLTTNRHFKFEIMYLKKLDNINKQKGLRN